MRTERYRQIIEANLPRWQSLLQELVRIPSCFEAEHAIVEKVARHIEGLGVAAHRIPHHAATLRKLSTAQQPISDGADRFSLAARLAGTSGGQSIAISTHMDVVPAGDVAAWTHPPFSGYVDRQRNVIFGRGAVDGKAGLVASLAVLEVLNGQSPRLPGDVVFHYVLEDEITGNGSLLCLEAGFAADAALIIDGTRLERAINQHAGQLQFEITLKGKPASISVSHLGVNAAEMMARLTVHLRDAVFALNGGRIAPWDRFPSPFQFVLQRLESRGEVQTVPEQAIAQVYVTFPPQFTMASMRDFLERSAAAFIAQFLLPEAPTFHWNGFAAEPVESNTSALEESLHETARQLGMKPIDVGPSTGTSDMRHFKEAGIPCLLYGPGNGFNPHRANEHYFLDDLPRVILFYLTLIEMWCDAKRA